MAAKNNGLFELYFFFLEEMINEVISNSYMPQDMVQEKKKTIQNCIQS